MVRWLLLALALACGAPAPMLSVRPPVAESYAFACECGSRHFFVVSSSRYVVRLACLDCGRTWRVYR